MFTFSTVDQLFPTVKQTFGPLRFSEAFPGFVKSHARAAKFLATFGMGVGEMEQSVGERSDCVQITKSCFSAL